MAVFCLVPGAWHGAWCWQLVAPLLEARGHYVLLPDLVSLGEDSTSPAEVTLARWADDVASAVQTAGEPVVLVGHSRGGIIISEVAERVPSAVACLVYLAAFLLPDGKSVTDVAVSAEDEDAGAMMTPDGHGGLAIGRAFVGPRFYNETAADWVATAEKLVKPEPIAGLTTPVHVTRQNFGSVPRAYIECLKDMAVPIALQRTMQEGWPCDPVVTLDSDHSPFFSMPEELADSLDQVAAQIVRAPA